MLDKNQKSRVLDELAFIVFSGNLRPSVSDENQPDDDEGVEDEEDEEVVNA